MPQCIFIMTTNTLKLHTDAGNPPTESPTSNATSLKLSKTEFALVVRVLSELREALSRPMSDDQTAIVFIEIKSAVVNRQQQAEQAVSNPQDVIWQF